MGINFMKYKEQAFKTKKILMDPHEQLQILKKGVTEIVSEEELLKKLETMQPLNIKLGFDPTAPDIHMGHTVVLRKLKAFQDLGHRITVIIGDYTAAVGDPTGRIQTRKQLTREEILINATTYETQIFKILNPQETKVRFNSEWLKKLSFADVIQLSAKYTVARMLEREDFKKRYANQQPIALHEFLYPLMQGYDSVALNADVEVGGTDQKFNILMGRTLQREYGNKNVQVGIFMPILEGIDGEKKMSKSLNNYIGIDEKPDEIYKKVMSIPDSLIVKYYELLTDLHPDDIKNIATALQSPSTNPRNVKMDLAHELVKLYYGNDVANKAQSNFKEIFQLGMISQSVLDAMDEVEVLREDIDEDGSVYMPRLLVKANLLSSTSEAMRMIKQGAVKLDQQRIDKNTVDVRQLRDGGVIQVGKKNFRKIKIQDFDNIEKVILEKREELLESSLGLNVSESGEQSDKK